MLFLPVIDMKFALSGLLFFVFLWQCPLNAQQPQWGWANSYGANGDDEGWTTCSDKKGNIYITGYFSSSISFGSFPLSPSSAKNYFSAKFDSNGNCLWAKTLFAGWYVKGRDICCDSAGNVYATGVFDSGIISETDTIFTYGDDDVFLIKYDSTGTEQWIRTVGGADYDYSVGGLETDISGNVYVCGYYRSTQLYVEQDTLFLTGGSDAFLIKYNANGNLVWALNEGGQAYEIGMDIAIDEFENIYLTGSFNSPNLQIGGVNLLSVGGNDFFIVKYNKQGIVQWANQAYGNQSEGGGSISVDNNNDVVVVGSYNGDSIYFDSLNYFTSSMSSYYKLFITKYDSIGNILWVQSPEDHSQIKTDICIDKFNNIFITGTYGDYYDFGSVYLSGYPDPNPFIVKYNPQGVAQWAIGAYGSSQDQSYGICIGKDNNLYITGFMISPFVAFGSDTVYNSNLNSSDIFLAKLTVPENLTDTQQINLPPGWQIISSYINPATPLMDSVLSGLDSSLVIMKDDLGNVYYPQYNINMIGDFAFPEGYQVKMSVADTLLVKGEAVLPENEALPVQAG